MISSTVYDKLKEISQCWFPVTMTLIGVILSSIGYSNAGIVMTILGGIDTALGTIVTYYKSKYDKTNAAEMDAVLATLDAEDGVIDDLDDAQG